MMYPHTKARCDAVSTIAESIVKNNGNGNLSFAALEYRNEETKELIKAEFSNADANDAYNGAKLAIGKLENRRGAMYNNVLMYFYQTNIDESKNMVEREKKQ